VVIPGYVRQPLEYYYSNQSDGTLLYGLYTTADLERVSASAGGHRVFYVLTSDVSSTDPAGNVVRWLEDHTDMDQAVRYGPRHLPAPLRVRGPWAPIPRPRNSRGS